MTNEDPKHLRHTDTPQTPDPTDERATAQAVVKESEAVSEPVEPPPVSLRRTQVAIAPMATTPPRKPAIVATQVRTLPTPLSNHRATPIGFADPLDSNPNGPSVIESSNPPSSRVPQPSPIAKAPTVVEEAPSSKREAPVIVAPAKPFDSLPVVAMSSAHAPKPLGESRKKATSFPTPCPNCQRQVMVPPGGRAQCIFCGTLTNELGVALAPSPAKPGFALTGHTSSEEAERAAQRSVEASQQAPAKPKASLEGQLMAVCQQAILVASTGQKHYLLPGVEVRFGRDGSICSILYNDGRISSVHASLKLEKNVVYVRDERSSNGTFVNGLKAQPLVWVPVAYGAKLRFGPLEFTVQSAAPVTVY